ncbi:putative Snf1 kinase complex beta-subunit Gal83 [Aspergillus clavatus NRRL 1]|uniref:Snf1 kinase complex beta-subunit Gal83, putative n=1 Tax=Aspergillus clavatus (strain ATCC 1007 / CBS 513.65 / DSM 816 / NCTC 3887 / NRRL 1 / QM 1276 / 107) TaxID=344612 RepID=A1CM93_ASPCL|nr:Snf1 kinase complex beta-subunit Gal83, putative [Aspergillus clavatus NRRL 1]EAW08680.1 Snf1 kinase complex beta-subunit Gal83, putative [Aspergillus clavatus NRRL 1]
MGNNPSKGPSGDGPPNSGSSHLTASAGDKKVYRRTSTNAISSAAKATAAGPTPSTETATGHPATPTQTPVQQRLQSRNITDAPRGNPDRQDRHDAKKTEPSSREISSPDPSNPVQVPVARAASRDDPTVAPSAPPLNTYYSASTHLQRPPRLPLPIGDATATPGSPIIGPEDSHIGFLSGDRPLGEQADQGNPGISNTAVDDEETLDELEPYTPSGVGRAVPTTIEWNAPGDKVYVTGTFVNWEKKYRLHRNENNPGVMSTTLNLRPGTHHLKFIVDGEMRASDTLPTAVDFTNHLVNYIEVSADDINRSRRESERTNKSAVPSGVHPPQVLPGPIGSERTNVEDQSDKEEPEEIILGDFQTIIPQFLVDLDKEEDSPEYQQAANVIGDTPTPPSLPLFLGKSILNGTTPMKDDSSVLNYPNHTVLNHLATSSIKNGVLATSATTRYKRKYVTTILYKPTSHITG